MEIGCTVEELTGSPERIGMWDASRLAAFRKHRHYQHLCEVIDTMGVMSKEAQGINLPLTSVARLKDSPTHRLYLLCEAGKCLGILKVGVKKLFIRNKVGALTEIDPLCVLDFFVCTAEQRSGYGKQLYEYMIQAEGVLPEQLGIDRPSPKFLGFMKKHYGLCEFVPQTNNFVVFNQYFTTKRGPTGGVADTNNPYARNYGGGYARGPLQQVASGGLQPQGRLTLDQAKAAITGPSASTGVAMASLPPIRAPSIGSSEGPVPLGQPPVPMSLNSSTNSTNVNASIYTRQSIGSNARGGSQIIGSRRAQSPTLSAVNYNILSPGVDVSKGPSSQAPGYQLGRGRVARY